MTPPSQLSSKPKDPNCPADIRPDWFRLIRRLQSVARIDNGYYSVLKVTIVVDPDGTPRIWGTPRYIGLENTSSIEELFGKMIDNLP